MQASRVRRVAPVNASRCLSEHIVTNIRATGTTRRPNATSGPGGVDFPRRSETTDSVLDGAAPVIDEGGWSYLDTSRRTPRAPEPR
jgi:hypothetical protein